MTCTSAISLFLVGIVAAACASTEPTSAGLMLVIDTDLAPGKDFDRLQIEVRPPAGSAEYSKVFSEFGQPGLPLSFPTTLAVLNRSRGAESVTFRVSVGKSGTENSPVGKPLILREVVTQMPTDRVALLRIHLEWLCIGTAGARPDYVEGLCPDGETCLGGKCEAWGIDSQALPTYDDRNVFGNGSPKGEGACFDTATCFAAGSATFPDAACSVAAPSDSNARENVNLALVVPEGAGGICSGGICLILLEPQSPYGWMRQEGRLQLPPAVCERIAKKQALGIAITTGCPAKSTAVPTCGPWSAIKKPAALGTQRPSGF
jgi:hypothetical protein